MGILLEKLTEYANTDFYPYHMPGHKRHPSGSFPEQVTCMDITEIDGFDNLHQPEGILQEAQRRSALAYGAEESFYLINGSTCGILSAVSAAVPFGGHMLIARNCHKSVYHAAYLRQLQLSYIYPGILSEFDICEAVTADQVEEALEKDTTIQAVLIVSPTYEGRIADVRAIAEVVHAKGLVLIVDEAHGAHLGFHSGFAINSVRQGADLVINSVHKTLPAMTQTALLHCSGSLVNREKLRQFLHIYQSSSPSYIMMASIDHAVDTAVTHPELFETFMNHWKELLCRLEQLQSLQILPMQKNAKERAVVEMSDILPAQKQDIGKLIISVKNTSMPGRQLADILRENYHLQMEMACETYVLAMFTILDTKEGYDRLTEALLEIDRELVRVKSCCQCEQEHPAEGIPFYQAWDGEKEECSLEEAEGRMAGEFINLYPPGTPVAVPGEILNRETILLLQRYLSSGLEVQGIHKRDDKYVVTVLSDNK